MYEHAEMLVGSFATATTAGPEVCLVKSKPNT